MNIFGNNQNTAVGIFLAIFVTSLCGFFAFLFQAQYDADLQAFATLLAAMLAASVVGWQIHSAAHLERLSHQRQKITTVYSELSKCIFEAQNALLALPFKRKLVEDIDKLQFPDKQMKFDAVENAIKDFSAQYDIQQSKISEFVDILHCWRPIIPNSSALVLGLHPLRVDMIKLYLKIWRGLQEFKLQIYATGNGSNQVDLLHVLPEDSSSIDSIAKELHTRLASAHLELRELIR